MRRVRRKDQSVRVEMTPLIDVVFLLLTFFVFSLALMVRADILDIRLPIIDAGRGAAPGPSITLAIDSEGAIFVDGQPATLDELARVIQERRALTPEAALLVATDENASAGALLRVVDRLAEARILDFQLIGRDEPE